MPSPALSSCEPVPHINSECIAPAPSANNCSEYGDTLEDSRSDPAYDEDRHRTQKHTGDGRTPLWHQPAPVGLVKHHDDDRMHQIDAHRCRRGQSHLSSSHA